MMRMRDQLSSVGGKACGELTLLQAVADDVLVVVVVDVSVVVVAVAEVLLLLYAADAAKAADAVAVV